MGCATSKLDDLPAVALCRHRCALLDDAVRHRFAFAQSHAAYLHSLDAVGLSLHRFFNQHLEPSPEKSSGSQSDSGSHLKFHSDSDEDGSGLHHDGNSPVHKHESYGDFDGGGFRNLSYAKKETTSSEVHTERPMRGETMRVGESSASYHPDPNYSNINEYSDYGGDVVAKAPAPPPPPTNSAWEFLNPFDPYEKYYPVYSTPSHDSSEEIPDLEEDDEVVKEVDGDQKVMDSKSKEDDKVANDAEFEGRSKDGDEFKPRVGFKDDFEVVKEIQLQFGRASESGNDLAKFLEVGKLQHKGKNSSHHVMLHLPAVLSKTSDSADPTLLDIHQDVELTSKNLSSTLHKLYLWEKKLYEQVKAEEKMRVVHERKSQKMKRMDDRGSEARKVDATRSLVKSLSSRIKIAIQVVDKISVKINRLRDEELWPQLNEFIQGLTRMWKSMLECHRNQCQAIREAKRLDAIASHKHVTDSHFEATRQLQHDLINWTLWFSHWIDAQKGYVRALNSWLMKCLLYIPEETSDGIAPFSPGRMGAPAVFVICHQWSQSLDRVSEKEVIDSMRDLASNVLQFWERDKAEIRQRMLANKDETKIKSLEKEGQKIYKEIQALEDARRMARITDAPLNGHHPVYQSETNKGGSLQASLQHVLEAMGQFTANSLKVYEELLQRIEDDHLAHEK